MNNEFAEDKQVAATVIVTIRVAPFPTAITAARRAMGLCSQGAWKENLAPRGTAVRFISDDSGAFASALGLVFDATSILGGVRSKRFVIVANGDKVETIAVEQVPSELTVTDAKTILAQLA
ncbi:hypothetical protein C8R43DRAFT_1194975 [Mycena crocata]|nr:hypothetical protein C8R43DRAFT_1194975 [Mycena crocata]